MNFARQLSLTSYTLLFLLLQTILAVSLFVTEQRASLQEQNQINADLKNDFQAAIAHHRELATLLFQHSLNTPQNRAILKQAITADSKGQAQLRQALYNELKPSFINIKDIIRQIHFHLPDGTSFLRMHRPEEYGDDLSQVRESIALMVQKKEFSEGFELGRNSYAIRYIFPLRGTDQTVIGSVELGLPFYHFRRHLTEFTGGTYMLLVRQDVAQKKLRHTAADNFIASSLSADFVTEKADIVDLAHVRPAPDPDQISPTLLQDINQEIRQAAQKPLTRNQPFSLATKIKTQNYQMSFIPLQNIVAANIGYLVRYNKITPPVYMQQGFILAYGIGTTLIVALLLLYRWSTNKIFSQLHFQQDLINAIPTPLFYTNSQGHYLGGNTSFHATFAPRRQGDRPDDSPLPQQLLHLSSITATTPMEEEIQLPDRHNRERYFYSYKTQYTNTSEHGQGTIVTLFDISTRKNAENELKKSHQEIEQIFNTAADGMRVVDKEHNMLRVNDRFMQMSGLTKAELLDHKCYEVFGGANCMTEACPLNRILAGEEWVEIETEKTLPSGRMFPCIVTATPHRDQRGKVIGIVEDFKDISERKEFEQKLKLLSCTDDLTGLMNRRGFIESAERTLQLAKRQQKDMVMLFADLDDMKDINDTYGHKQGDLALQHTAHLLRETYRETDTIGRLGGDEFAILLFDATDHEPSSILDRFATNLNEWNLHSPANFTLALSIGIVRYDPAGAEDMEGLLHRADQAMYAVKRSRKKP